MIVSPPPVGNLALPARPLERQVPLMPFGEVRPVAAVLRAIPTVVVVMVVVVEADDDR
jgi:hypothetical protein